MSKSFSQIVVSALLAGGLCSVAIAKTDSDSLATELNQHLKVNNSKFLGIPVGFKGNMSTRVHKGTFMGDVPQFATAYSNRLVPDADLNLRIEANPRPEITVSTVLNFGYNFLGNYQNDYSNTAYLGNSKGPQVTFDENRALINRSPEREGVSMMEEMIAAIDIRTSKVKAKLEAGSALWVEMSPFTIWRRDPRPRHSWYYETYDPEYKAETRNLYNMFTRNDWGGTSVWPRKTFGGVQLDMYELPAGLKAKFLLTEPVNYRPGMQTSTSLSHWGDVEAITALSNMGHVYAARISQNTWIPTQEIGFNYVGFDYNDDLINECVITSFGNKCIKYQFEHDSTGYEPVVYEPQVYSIDSRGMLSGSMYLHTDLAVSVENTVSYAGYDSLASLGKVGYAEVTDASKTQEERDSVFLALTKDPNYQHRYLDPTYGVGDVGVAAYVKLYEAGGVLPYSLELSYIEKDFISPYGMTEFAVPIPVDEMTLGTGSFNYRPNMTGVNLTLMPNLLNGYLRFTYGAHAQVEAGKDILRFQHKLVGRDLWKSSFSWSRTDPTRNFDVGHATNTSDRAQLRMGDWTDSRDQTFAHDQTGGYLGDDLELWERFHFVDDAQLQLYKDKDAAYDSLGKADDVLGQFNLIADTDLNKANYDVPSEVLHSKKYAATAAVDYGTHLSALWRGKTHVFVNVFAEYNQISDEGAGLLVGLGNKMLSSKLLTTEMSVNLFKGFYLIGTAGYETFDSPNAIRNVVFGNGLEQSPDYVVSPTAYQAFKKSSAEYSINYSPIEYQAIAAGAGFDWDFSDRAGLHFRYKWMQHKDIWAGKFIEKIETLQAKLLDIDNKGAAAALDNYKIINDYELGFFFLETKVWF